jgi:hypothetical protein
MVEREHAELSVVTQTRLLELDRSGVYYVPVMVSAEELAIKHQIDELYTRWPFYGSRKIADELGINRKAAQRHMRDASTSSAGDSRDMPWAKFEQKSGKSRGISVSVARAADHSPQSCLGHRHYVYSHVERLDVSGGRVGLVFALCGQLGIGQFP